MDVDAKAARAKSILSDTVFKEALDVVTSYHMDVFKNAASTQEEVLEAHRMVRALALIENQLQSFVDDAAILKRRMERKTNV